MRGELVCPPFPCLLVILFPFLLLFLSTRKYIAEVVSRPDNRGTIRACAKKNWGTGGGVRRVTGCGSGKVDGKNPLSSFFLTPCSITSAPPPPPVNSPAVAAASGRQYLWVYGQRR